jgi:hypothetical protein
VYEFIIEDLWIAGRNKNPEANRQNPNPGTPNRFLSFPGLSSQNTSTGSRISENSIF